MTQINKTKLVAVLTILLLLLLPTIVKAEELNTDLGAWAVVDETGNVINIEVCSEAVCGTNGEWQGKVPYCETCKYVYQLPAESSGNVAGYKDVPYDSANNSFTLKDNKTIKNGVIEYPICSTDYVNQPEFCYNETNDLISSVDFLQSQTKEVTIVNDTNTTTEVYSVQSRDYIDAKLDRLLLELSALGW